MILLISEIKKFLRKYLPNKVYISIYKFFKKIKGEKFLLEKQQKQMHFRKAGAYKFSLEDVSFPIILNPNNGGVDSEIYSDGVYEPDILKTIRGILTKDLVFVDVGANIGQHSLYSSLFAKEVYAFEPIDRIYKQFVESVNLNNFTNIHVYNYALGNEKKVLPIFGNVGNMGASSIITSENRKKIQNINIFRFDDVSAELGIVKVDFMKIDVEGYELDVLLGARNSIKKYKPSILLEFSPYFYKQVDASVSNKILNFLLELEYTIYDIGDGSTERKLITKDIDLTKIEQTNLLCLYEKN